MALVCVAMYHCFLNGAPAQGRMRMIYTAGTGIFCILLWAASVGTVWYIKRIQKERKEYKEILDTLLKNTDELDK